MTNPEEQPTCGKGLAANAVLLGKVAQFLSSQADNLDIHMKSLDVDDPDARRERRAYASLLGKYRKIVTDLDSVASEMAGYEDLPMAPHDEEALAAPEGMEVFRNHVQVEAELLEMLRASQEEYRGMLKAMDIP